MNYAFIHWLIHWLLAGELLYWEESTPKQPSRLPTANTFLHVVSALHFYSLSLASKCALEYSVSVGLTKGCPLAQVNGFFKPLLDGQLSWVTSSSFWFIYFLAQCSQFELLADAHCWWVSALRAHNDSLAEFRLIYCSPTATAGIENIYNLIILPMNLLGF